MPDRVDLMPLPRIEVAEDPDGSKTPIKAWLAAASSQPTSYVANSPYKRASDGRF